jgi:hypothetical protein
MKNLINAVIYLLIFMAVYDLISDRRESSYISNILLVCVLFQEIRWISRGFGANTNFMRSDDPEHGC